MENLTRYVRDRWIWVVLAALIGGLIGIGLALRAAEAWVADSLVVLTDARIPPEQYADVAAAILPTDAVLGSVITSQGLDATPRSLVASGALRVESAPGGTAARVIARTNDEQLSEDLANAAAASLAQVSQTNGLGSTAPFFSQNARLEPKPIARLVLTGTILGALVAIGAVALLFLMRGRPQRSQHVVAPNVTVRIHVDGKDPITITPETSLAGLWFGFVSPDPSMEVAGIMIEEGSAPWAVTAVADTISSMAAEDASGTITWHPASERPQHEGADRIVVLAPAGDVRPRGGRSTRDRGPLAGCLRRARAHLSLEPHVMVATARARSGPLTDTDLLGWFRHYVTVLLIVTGLGAAAGFAFGWVATPRYEMWSILIDTEHVLPAPQLGVVSETLFSAQTTYAQALATLGPSTTLGELTDAVELRPVPESRLMIIVARGNDPQRTAAMADAMAHALSDTFRNSQYPGFEILGSPQPSLVPSRGSPLLFAGLGATVALLIAFGGAIIHYRTRRPVLELQSAIALLSPTRVVAISARGRWAGALRHMVRVRLSSSARVLAVEGLQLDDTVADIKWPGSSGRRLERIANLVDVHREPDAEVIVIVVDPCSRSCDLAEVATGTDAPTVALWLA